VSDGVVVDVSVVDTAATVEDVGGVVVEAKAVGATVIVVVSDKLVADASVLNVREVVEESKVVDA
jgi:hypothetical protein